MNTTDFFIEEIYAFSQQHWPDSVLHQVQRCFLDYLGVATAGAFSSQKKLDVLLQITNTPGNCSIIGTEHKTSFLNAATINGFLSHVLELDDGHRFGMLHLEAPIFSAMIALLQNTQLTRQNFIKGIVVGYEATVRLAKAIQPQHKQNGFHATGTCGTIGVSCAVAAALNFTKEELKNCVSAAATSASGLLEVITGNSQLKPYNITSAVLNGIISTYYGKAGFVGPSDILAGKRGFFNTLTGSFSRSSLKNDNTYAIEGIYVKPYAACRHCHAPIECALNLVNRHSFLNSDIQSISVTTYKLAVFGHDHTQISGINDAKMSIPYSVAAAMVLKTGGIEAFSPEALINPDILSLASVISVIEDPHFTSLCPNKRAACLSVTLTNGTNISEIVEYPLGEPENKISDQALADKFYSLMNYAQIPKVKTDELFRLVQRFDDESLEQLKNIL